MCLRRGMQLVCMCELKDKILRFLRVFCQMQLVCMCELKDVEPLEIALSDIDATRVYVRVEGRRRGRRQRGEQMQLVCMCELKANGI